MSVDQEYTQDDHEFRDHDSYAAGKYALTKRWLLERPIAGGTLFHIGCGSGIFNHTATDLGYRVEAFEPDPVVAARARATAPANCSVREDPLEAIPGEHVADVIVMHDVLEHIEDEAVAVAALQRLLKPGGTLIISVPAMPSLFGYHDELLGHFRRYTRTSLRSALDRRFEIDQCRSYGMSFIPITWLLSRRLRRPYPTDSVGSGGLVGKAMALVCAAESRVPTPIGTSLIIRAHPRHDASTTRS